MSTESNSADERIKRLIPNKQYLGDSVYVEYDGYHVILTTNNRYPDDPRNRIALEGQVIQSFDRYVKQLRAMLQELDRASQ